MSRLFLGGAPQKPIEKKEDELAKARRGLRLIRSGVQVAHEIHVGNPAQAVQKAIIAGMKLASHDSIFYDPLVNPLRLAKELKKLGLHALTWTPETLCAEIDRQYGDWTSEQISQALEQFHSTGIIQTDVPLLVRQKLYAIRIVATSDSAQTEWNIFEKVGGAFNDRPVNFSLSEPMNAAECAFTISVMEDIRPDSYTNEIKIYVAAAAHQDGLLTIEPIKWISMAEPALQQMNRESTGTDIASDTKQKIKERFNELKQNAATLKETPEDLISTQALKLLAVDSYAAEALAHG